MYETPKTRRNYLIAKVSFKITVLYLQKLVYVFLAFLWKLGDQSIQSNIQQVNVHFFECLFLKWNFFYIIISYSPVEQQIIQRIAQSFYLLCCMFLSYSYTYRIFCRPIYQKVSAYGFAFIKKMNYWQTKFTFTHHIKNFVVKRLNNDRKILLLALLMIVETIYFQYLH